MRVLRARRGFQADHSSSSYLFYAADKDVSKAGQQIAHRYSSRAEVDERYARYVKWGDSDLAMTAFPALLGTHYDVMASESYDTWTLMIAMPKTPQTQARLAPFHDLDDGEFTRVDVEDYGDRLALRLFCHFDYEGPLFRKGEDTLEELVELLTVIREEILQGDVSFPQAVSDFYGCGEEESDEEDEDEEAPPAPASPPPWKARRLTKAELQNECRARNISFRQSWTRDQLTAALDAAAAPLRIAGRPEGRASRKLSKAARTIVDSLDRV